MEDTYGDCSDEYFELIDNFHGEVKMNPDRDWFIDFEITEPRLDRYSFDEIIYSGEFVSQSFSVDELRRVENVNKFLVNFTETVEKEMKEDAEKFVKNLQNNEKWRKLFEDYCE